jgi:hypothetical protein
MARYRKVSTNIWNDARFRSLSDEAQLLFLFLLTHPQMTPLGAIRATIPGLAAERGWSEKGFREAFLEVSAKGMAKASEEASMIWLPKFLRHNPPENPNVVKSWRGGADELPECALYFEMIQEVRAFVEGLSEGFQEPFRKGFPEAFAKGSRNQEQEQEQEEDPPPAGARTRGTDRRELHWRRARLDITPAPPALSDQAITDWLDWRKDVRRAPCNQTVVTRACQELAACVADGWAADDAMAACMNAGWSEPNAQWLRNRFTDKPKGGGGAAAATQGYADRLAERERRRQREAESVSS